MLRLGTRTSRLATWQAEHVAAGLRAAWPGLGVELTPFVTRGDKVLDTPLPLIGGKGLFTAELEAALREGRLDLAVHSLKDLPTEDPDGLILGAILPRENPRDVWVCEAGHTLQTLPEQAVIGTSSPRRAAQLKRLRPDLQIESIRGNVETRLRKASAPPYDATVLAHAGLDRLGLLERGTAVLDFETMLPAPGQAALAVQIRADDERVGRLIRALDHTPTRMAVEAERAFLSALGGGCSAPIAALGSIEDGTLQLRGRVSKTDGSHTIDVSCAVPVGPDAAVNAGQKAAELALEQGASALLT
ncbi:MAG: hydroxymethylbilane synthase [Bacteroidota bacterium]